MKKSTCVALLVCVNLVLLTGVIVVSYEPPAALAQGTGLAANFMMVAGEIQDQYDALYIIDLRHRTLHAFQFDRGTKALEYKDWRDLRLDFRNEGD